MTFSKHDDGCWHWECSSGYIKGSFRSLQISWLIIVAILAVAFLIAAIRTSAYLMVLGLFAAMVLLITVLFVLCWLPFRLLKKRYCYTADEHAIAPFSQMTHGAKTCLRFDEVRSLTRIPEKHLIELRSAPIPMPVYASEEDYEQVWLFLKERCPGAEVVEITHNGSETMTVRTEPSRKRRLKQRAAVLFAIGLVALVLALGNGIGWSTRGPRIRDFTGLGKAMITELNYTYTSGHSRYSYTAVCSISGRSFTYKGQRSSRSGWEVGSVLPVTFNRKDPSEFVIGQTPEQYARWYATLGLFTLGALLIGIGCLLCSRKLSKQADRAEKQVE